ncbi:GNAT family N-acetyltransferase [Oceanobacillus sp. CAU 1775]
MNRIQVKPISKKFMVKHIKELMEVVKGIPNENWDVENYLLERKGKWSFSCSIIENERKIVGCIIASIKDDFDSIHIHKFAVKNEYRGASLGKTLLNYLEENVIKSKYNSITLYVDKSNEGAINFYRNNDFKLIEERTNDFLMKKILKVDLN